MKKKFDQEILKYYQDIPVFLFFLGGAAGGSFLTSIVNWFHVLSVLRQIRRASLSDAGRFTDKQPVRFKQWAR